MMYVSPPLLLLLAVLYFIFGALWGYVFLPYIIDGIKKSKKK